MFVTASAYARVPVCPCLHVCRMCVSCTQAPSPPPFPPHPSSEQFPTPAFRSLGGSLAVPLLSLPSTHPTSVCPPPHPLPPPHPFISRHITPYIHEFPVYHENLCMKMEGGKGAPGGGEKTKTTEKKKINGVNADGGGGGVTRLGAVLCRQPTPSSRDVCKKTPTIPSPLFFSFHFFSLSPSTHLYAAPPPLLHPPPHSPPPHPTHPLPRCLSLFSSLLRTVKAGYRQRSAPS